jgi:aminoglycoside phosphotransferase (APT) family kinase protein
MNYLFLLDKNQAESFLSDKSELIFGQKKAIRISEIKRSKTFNEEGALNILYKLELDGNLMELRVSTSNFLDKEHDYNAMSYLYKNGFSEGQFVVPEPVAYLKEEKILIYKDVAGSSFVDEFKKQEINVEQTVKACAELVKKIHQLKVPSFGLFNAENLFLNFKFDLIAERFPEAGDLEQAISKIKGLLNTDSKSFCHGDFNPNNLLIRDGGIALIDFGMTSVFLKEVDLASFIAHLRQELTNSGQSMFEQLKNVFLTTYGSYEKNNLDLLIALIDARLLEISVIYATSKYDSEYLFSCLEDDLAKLDISMKNET